MGINPLVSMLLHHTRLVEEGKATGRVKLLYSARTEDELLFKVMCTIWRFFPQGVYRRTGFDEYLLMRNACFSRIRDQQ